VSREFPDWLHAFVEYAKFSETPEKFLYWSGVSAIAGALERRVWIDQWRFQLYPNFYVIFVAKAGRIQKSTTLNVSMELLRKVPGIKFSPKNTTWEGLIKKMDELHSADNIGLDLETPNTKTSAVMIVSSEFSLFFDPDNKGMVSALIELWDCPDDFDKYTVYREDEFLEKPCLNIIAATTPSWVRESFDRWTKEGGLPARTVFLHAERKRQYVAFPGRSLPKDHRALKPRLVKDLQHIGKMRGEFKLTEEAYEWGDTWYQAHCKELELEQGEITGFRDRKQAHVLKLAMVIAASRGDSLTITLDHLKEATTRITEVEGDFDAVFGVLNDRAELRPYNEILAYLKQHQKVELQALTKAHVRKYLFHELARALESILASGIATKRQIGDKWYILYSEEAPSGE
jgi:hypothetical protein